MIFLISITWSKSSFSGRALIVIVIFLGSTSIHLAFVTLHLFFFENSSSSSIKDLYSGLSFIFSLSCITSPTFTEIDGTSTLTQFNLKCA
jgi:hypothetical protein